MIVPASRHLQHAGVGDLRPGKRMAERSDTNLGIFRKRSTDMDDLKEFARSFNGDLWLLGRSEGSENAFVIHRGNLPSGGYETRMAAQVFLKQKPGDAGAERVASHVERSLSSVSCQRERRNAR